MNLFGPDRDFERFEDVTPEILRKEKVKLLLCDLDNTLRLHSEKEPADELAEWIEKCRKAGVKIVIISNNGRKKMIQKFCEPINVPCFWWAKKPVSRKLTAARHKYGFTTHETVMLGDKWLTDGLAARFAGIRAWQVEHRRKIV